MGISVKYDSASKRAKSLGKVEKQGEKNGGSGETRTHNQRLKRPSRLREALITNKPADSSRRDFFCLTRVYAASFSEKMFQYRGKEARIQ